MDTSQPEFNPALIKKEALADSMDGVMWKKIQSPYVIALTKIKKLISGTLETLGKDFDIQDGRVWASLLTSLKFQNGGFSAHFHRNMFNSLFPARKFSPALHFQNICYK